MKRVDVAIVGCGPVGAVATNLLSQQGLSVVIFDRAVEFHGETRAIHMDHEAMRILQAIGIDKDIQAYVRPFLGMEFVDHEHERIFLLRAADQESGEQGYMFSQPYLELALRKRIETQCSNAEMKLGYEVRSIEHFDEYAVLDVIDLKSRELEKIAATYVIASDGSSSPMRKQAGIGLQDIGFDEPWVVVDCELLEPVDLPNYGQQVCDLSRPCTFIPGENNHRRWEFMLLPGETPEEINDPDKLYELMAPWGISRENTVIHRSAYYLFHALTAERWRDRRLFLAGDACHQTPPFLGQGMCAGFRDVANLCWKLSLVKKGIADESLLDSYDLERSPHARKVVVAAVENGGIICTIDPEKAKIREKVFEEMAAQENLSFYDGIPPLDGGVLYRGDEQGRSGMLSLQPMIQVVNGEPALMDDIVGEGFRLITKEKRPLSKLDADNSIFWKNIAGQTAVFDSSAEQLNGVMVLEDTTGRVDRWLDEHQCRSLLIRPDHYVFGFADDVVGINDLIGDLRQQIAPLDT